MPLEVTPPPFSASQRLPYVPPIPRLETGGGSAFPSGASSVGGHGPGPVAAAASTTIPPAPGGMAGPHRAIPALPEAGYTSALAGMQGLSIGNQQAPGSLYGGSAYNSYAPRSVHELDPHEQNHHPHMHSPLSVVQSENDWAAASSLPAPRSRLPAEYIIAPRHGHHHHHHHHHQDINDDDFDRQTDASYYALPRHRGGRSRAGSASSASDSEDAREPLGGHHRSGSIGHGHVYKHHRSPSLPPHNANGNGRFHSPNSSSPLAGAGSPSQRGKSPLPPVDPRGRERGQRMLSPAPDGERRQRIYSHVPTEGESERGREPKSREQDIRETERGRRHSSGISEGGRPHMRRHNSAQIPVQHQQYQHQHGRHPSSLYGPQDIARGRDQSPPPPPWVGGPASTMGAMGQYPQDMGAGQYQRRRAVSMQGLERPGSYQPASVYDDAASVASHESNMTFMDGSIAGKTSQYGLPKYPHQPKMDYRRFCVQRGNADVFLD
ncbi:hypothetical protein L202_00385 [Cryptococcus amylolentus CBS 6039]|uniref:Uncharacterized protein n=1 Tax=Cryptococcus amylolentus CBS 6039 TaxID=1295533 RepID=A0A1E3I7U6_9TREE|nr:hypothetical protein L202_00385 [Cryptococcus amylolentus CBS 6039]ODN84435.1 hypothetical protein L202_00385 [Cryptococcus amylolentus CBS 6039]